MSFVFKTEDRIDSLPEKLISYFPTFLSQRFKDLDQLKSEVEINNYKGVSNFCHKQLGIAASYHLFRYEELVKELSKSYKDENYDHVTYLVKQIDIYLASTKAIIDQMT